MRSFRTAREPRIQRTGDSNRVNPVISGGVPLARPRYCERCRFNEGLPAPSPQLRRLELAREGISLPEDVPFTAEVLMKGSFPGGGVQVYFLGERKGAYARFLPEKYQCGGGCKSIIYALTLIGADEAHPLHSVYKPNEEEESGGAIEVGLGDITRTDGKSHHKRGTAEDLIIQYLRSMFNVR